MTYKESQAQEIPPDLEGRKPNEPIAWIASLDSHQNRAARITHKEGPAPKEVPQEATAPVNKTVIAVLRIVKIVLRISHTPSDKGSHSKVKKTSREYT